MRTKGAVLRSAGALPTRAGNPGSFRGCCSRSFLHAAGDPAARQNLPRHGSCSGQVVPWRALTRRLPAVRVLQCRSYRSRCALMVYSLQRNVGRLTFLAGLCRLSRIP